MSVGEEAAAFPERIRGYELLIPIGTGGMGTVYLGKSEVMAGVSREVAIKLMHPQLRTDEDQTRQLMEEARLAASIRHPNVVSVLEAGDSPHGMFLAMEYVEGDTLSALLRAARRQGELVPLPIVARILRDALSGLHAAHELADPHGRPLELVHRDFSPQNILIGTDGVSRLTDFGIAKALGQAGATATGIIKGKVGYMAPEHARGERVDRRSDLWSAGVVAWEAVTAKRLFSAANDAATLLLVVSDKRAPPPSRVRPELSPAIDQAIASALEPKPNRRVASAKALRERLDAAFADHGGIADPEEVAAYLEELVGDRLEQRRERARTMLALRSQLASASADAQAHLKSESTGSLGSAVDAAAFRDDSTHSAMSTASGERPRPRRWLAAAALASLGAGALAALLVMSDPPDAAPPEPHPAASAAPRALSIEANEPIAQLTIDARTIVVPEATRTLEIPLPDDAWPEKLSAMTRDGRRVERALEPGQPRVRLVFAAAEAAPASETAGPSETTSPPNQMASAAAPPARVPRPRPASPHPLPAPKPSPKLDDGPGLADSPY